MDKVSKIGKRKGEGGGYHEKAKGWRGYRKKLETFLTFEIIMEN